MIVVYTPEDGPEEQYDVRAVLTSEARIVARAADMTWGEIRLGVRDDDPTALRGVAWIHRKRQDPTLRWDGFDPPTGWLTGSFDAREVRGIAADIMALPEEKRPRAIAELRVYALDPAGVDIALRDAAAPPKDLTTETSTSDG